MAEWVLGNAGTDPPTGDEAETLRRVQERRSISRAIAIALALHIALLLLITPPDSSDRVSLLPDLRVFIEFPGEREVLEKVAAKVVGAAAPTESPVSQAPQPTARERAVRSEQDEAPAPPSESAAAAQPVESEAPQHSIRESDATAMPLAADSDFVTTTGSSPRQIEAPSPPPVPAMTWAMPKVERDQLATRLQRWAQTWGDGEIAKRRIEFKEDGRQYVAIVEGVEAASDTDFDRVRIVVTTREQGREFTSRMEMKRLAFSHFTQMVDQWDSRVQFHDDAIVGRFHSNSEIVVGWDGAVAPRFLGQVTTAANRYSVATEIGWRTRREIFQGGIDLRAKPITLPRRSRPFAAGALPRDADVRRFTADAAIVFHPDGSYSWRSGDGESRAAREQAESRPLYLLAQDRVALAVKGVVRGTVLVYSPTLVEIAGPLTYARDARSDPGSPDRLGIVSDGQVTIADERVTGPGDLAVDAAIYARQRFAVSGTHRRGGGTLAIFGSLSAGTMTETEPRFATRVEFDPRLERSRPPGFPMTSRFELERWDERWTPAN